MKYLLFILTERPQVFYLRTHVYYLIEAIGRTVELFNAKRPLFFDPTLVLKLALKKRNTNFCLEHSARKNGTTFSDVPLLLETLRWNDPKK